jgi:predicted phage terminase large subunit-like protein
VSIVKQIDYSKPYKASAFTLQFMGFREAMLTPKSNKTPMFHYALVDALNGSNEEQIVESFRGSGKSSVVTCDVPLYLALFGKAEWFNGEINYAMIVSETSTQAQDLIREIRNAYDESEALQAAMTLSIARSDELEFKIGERHFNLVAKGAGQSMRGIKRRGNRPQVIFVDDLEDDEAVMNKESRRKLKEWFFKVLLPARDPNNYKIFFVGTPLHDDSLLANLMSDSTWCPIKFPIMDANENPAWEDRFSKAWIDKEMNKFRKQGMGKAFFQEYMLQVVDDDDAVFKKDMFTYYEQGDIAKFLPQMNVFMSVDLAISKEDHADYTVISTIAVNSDNHWFVLNQDVSKSSMSEIINRLFGQISRYKPQMLILETIAFQLAFKGMVEEEMLRRNSFVRIETTKKMKKELKIQSMQPRYVTQSVHHPKGEASWIKDLEEQLIMFRPEGALTKHDDQIDSLSFFSEHAYAPSDMSENSKEYIGYEIEEYRNPYF